MNSLTDSSTRRPEGGANKRTGASMQIRSRIQEKKLFFNVLPYSIMLHLRHVTSVLYCAHDMRYRYSYVLLKSFFLVMHTLYLMTTDIQFYINTKVSKMPCSYHGTEKT